MKVHFITSRDSLENDIETLQDIMQHIKSAGHTLANDWIDVASERQRSGKQSTADWKRIYKDNLENVAETDVLVAEASYENFGVGYQVAAAVQQKKPVLLLRHEDADKGAFVTGVEDGWVQSKEYNKNNLGSILQFTTTFAGQRLKRVKLKQRFCVALCSKRSTDAILNIGNILA
jgi:predicted nucleotidyltransferase